MRDVFFGLQVAVLAPPHDPWRRRLSALVRQYVRDLPLQDQRGLFGSLANLLHEAIDRCPLGYWDFVWDGESEYVEWVTGIEDDAAELWAPDTSGDRMDHVLVSALFLLSGEGASATVAGDRCALPEDEWQTRATWRCLFETLGMLDFASVRSCALYVTPGGDRQAFSLRELRGEGYAYLVPVE